MLLPTKFTLDRDRFRLYYHDVQRGIFGRRLWTRTTLHSKSFDFGNRTEPLIVDHAHRIWLPPWTVLRQVHSPTPWEYVHRVGRLYDPRNWPRMFKGWWLPRYRELKQRIDERRQSPLHTRFGSELKDFPNDRPSNATKAEWDILFDGLSGSCKKKGMFQLQQFSCLRLDDGGIVCQVKLIIFGDGWVKGLVYIPSSTMAELAGSKEELSSRVLGAFTKYYCRWRPRTTFVREIQL